MAVLLRENGAEQVRDVVYGRERVRLPFIVLMEVEYKLLQVSPGIVDESLALLDVWPVHTIESYYSWRREAARVKSRGRLSVADAWVAALALIDDAELVHKDPEFDGVDGLKAVRLPYDRDNAGRSN